MAYDPPIYPGEIPSEAELFPWADDEDYVSREKFLAIMKELRAALLELGTDPAAAYDTVKDRLAGMTAFLVPTGAIIMWSGSIATIPTGWALCDGEGGRPNLLDKFVKGVPNAGTDPGSAGGSEETEDHTLTEAEMPAHVHVQERYANTGDSGEGSGSDHCKGGTEMNTQSKGGGGAHKHDQNKPPYYEIAYIIKTA